MLLLGREYTYNEDRENQSYKAKLYYSFEDDKTLLIFDGESRIRVMCNQCIKSKIFEFIVLIIVIVYCVLLANLNPLDS